MADPEEVPAVVAAAVAEVSSPYGEGLTGANRWNPYYSSFFAEKHKEIRISSANVVNHLYGWPMKKLKIVFVLI